MKKLLLIIPLLMGLVGCDVDGAQVVVKNNYVVVTPPPSLYNCPVVRVPNTDGLSNADIARYIVAQYRANVTCRNNMSAIKVYVAKAKQIYGN